MTHEEYKKASDRSKEEAQRIIFNEYFKYVYTIVFSRLRSCASREDIEECVGDVFADVYIHYDSSKATGDNISGFIGTVARNKAADMYRKLTRKRFTFVSVDDEDVPEQEAPENTDAGIRISGDSMEPVIQNGEIVFVTDGTSICYLEGEY